MSDRELTQEVQHVTLKWSVTSISGSILCDGDVWDAADDKVGQNNESPGSWAGVMGNVAIRHGQHARWTLNIERGTYHLVGVATAAWASDQKWNCCTRGQPWTHTQDEDCPFAMVYSNHANHHQGAGINNSGATWNGSPQIVSIELDTASRRFSFRSQGRNCVMTYPSTDEWTEVYPAFAAQGGFGGSRARIVEFRLTDASQINDLMPKCEATELKWSATCIDGSICDDGVTWDALGDRVGGNNELAGSWAGVMGDAVILPGQRAKWTLKIDVGQYHLVGIATMAWASDENWKLCTRGQPWTRTEAADCPFAMVYSNHANLHQGAAINTDGSKWNGAPQLVSIDLDTGARQFRFESHRRQCVVTYPKTDNWNEVYPAFAAQGGYGGSRVSIVDFKVLHTVVLTVSKSFEDSCDGQYVSFTNIGGTEVCKIHVQPKQGLPSDLWTLLAAKAGVADSQLKLVLPDGNPVDNSTPSASISRHLFDDFIQGQDEVQNQNSSSSESLSAS